MAYSLKIGTAAATFASLGIASARLQEDCEGRSQLELETPGSIGAAAIIAPFERVLLLDGAGTVRFAGWLDEAPRSARGDAHRTTYRLTGPHRWLARANFVQMRGGLVILGGAAGDTDVAPVAWNAAVGEILDAALAEYASAFTYTGASAFTHEIPSRLRADVDCHTALLSLVSFAPTAVFWWTYDASTGAPALNIGTGAGTATKTLSAATHQISAAELNPRYDLLADVEKVYFVSGNTVSSEQTAASAGDASALGADRTVLFTYDTSVLNSLPASGIAAALASWHQTLHIDASATRHDIDWADRPGHIYTFAGDDLGIFSSYQSILHTIERDLFAGTTGLRLGVIPGKTLFKVNDLDQAGGNAETHAAAPVVPTAVASGLEAGKLSFKSGTGATAKEVSLDVADLPEGATIIWRQVENCNGLKAYVAMSDWV